MTTEQMIEEAAQRIMDKAHHEVVYGNLSFVPDYLEALVKKELTTIATKAAEAELKGIAFSLRGMSKVELNIWCDATYNN